MSYLKSRMSSYLNTLTLGEIFLRIVILLVALFIGYYFSRMYLHTFAPPYDVAGTKWKNVDDQSTGEFQKNGDSYWGPWAQRENEITLHTGGRSTTWVNTTTGDKSSSSSSDRTLYLNGDKLEKKEYFLFFYTYQTIATKVP